MGAPSLSDISIFEQKVVIGVGGLAVSTNKGERLTTYSLGSCLGITIYDPVVRSGGMLHAMLPDSSINPGKASQQPGVFLDTGLPALFKAAYKLGLDKHRAQICVAGGAQILDKDGFFNIGDRNYAMLQQILAQHSLKIDAAQVGGMVSRTITLNIATGEVRLKTSGENAEITFFKG